MKNKNFIALIVLAIFSAISLFTVLSERNRVERSNNKVEMVIEYSELESLANHSEYSTLEWMQMFKEMGLTSVALGEQTLESYMVEYGITYESYLDLLNRGEDPFENNELLEGYGENSLILFIYDKEQADFLSNALSFYEDLEYLTIYNDKTNYIVINQDKEDVLTEETGDIYNEIGQNLGSIREYHGTEALNIPIGFDKNKVALIQEADLNLMLRPINYEEDPRGAWNLYLSEVEQYGLESKLFFPYGSQLIGYSPIPEENCIDEVYEYIIKNDLNFALVETMEQRDHSELTGYDEIMPMLPEDRFVRVFNTWSFISDRYQYLGKYDGPEEITNSYYRAITERNIKAIYLRPFSSETIRMVIDPLEYEKMFTSLEERLKPHGYSYGEATTFENFSVSVTMKIILTSQVIAYVIVLLNYLLSQIKLKYNLVIWGVGTVCVALSYYLMPNLSTSISALGSAITFSSLATIVFIKECLVKVNYQNFLKGILFTFICGTIAMIGGLYIGSIMASTRYFLEFEYFRGVKLSLVIPVLFISFCIIIFYVKDVFAQKGNNFFAELIDTTKKFLDANIKVKYVLILSVVALVGAIYLARGSNTSNVQPLDIELMMRNFLENNFMARPRTKEFLIAFPLVVFGTYFAGNKYFYKNDTDDNNLYFKYSYILFFAIVGIVGLSSITNTFSHIRTPIYISIYRTFYGLSLGSIIGLIYILIFKVLMYFINKLIGLFDKFKGDILENN